MKIIKINLNRISSETVNLIVDYLKRGLVIAYPTDTVYGLGCDAGNIKAIKKINKIKGETGNKPRLVLVSGFKMLKKYCFINSEQMKYLKIVWPGSVTVILKSRPNSHLKPASGLNSLAVRLPDNEFLIKLIKLAGFPIISTSLNKKRKNPLANVKNLVKYFKYLPDLAIDAGECARTKPSRLIDLRDIKNIKVLRE